MNFTAPVQKYISKGIQFPAVHVFAQKTVPFLRAQNLVRFYYFCLLFFSVFLFTNWWDVSFVTQSVISPFWPTSWIYLVSPIFAVYSIRLLFIAGAFLAAVFPEQRFARVVAFLGLIEFVSLYASFWKLDVDWYTWILVAFLLIFLPKGWSNPIKATLLTRQKFLLIFWGSQAIVLLTYSMSALGKIFGSTSQFLLGEAHSFSIEASALHIADRLLATNATSVFGPLVINHPWIGWPFFVGAIYLMLFAFFASFRLSLQRVWGIGLILYHIGAYLTMNIAFSSNILLLALLLLHSPFKEQNTKWQTILLDIPLFGWVFRLYLAKRK